MESRILDYIDFERANIFLEGFSKATGFVAAILDLDGNILAKSGWRKICTDFHRKNPEAALNCTFSDTKLAKKLRDDKKYHYYKCVNGLIDVWAPIVIRGEHVANLFSGQFFFEEPDISFFIKQAEIFGFEELAYLEALGKVPVFSKEEVENAMNFLLDITQTVIEMTADKLDQIELNEALEKSEAALQESEHRLIAAQKMAHVGNWELSLDTKTIWASEEAFNIYGIERKSQYLSLYTVQDLVLPEYRKLLDDKLAGLLTKTEIYDVEFKIKKANTAKEIFIHSIALLQRDDTGKPYRVAGTIQDITDKKEAEEDLIFTSYHDHLTSLYNRRYFEEKKSLLDREEMLPLSIVVSDINGLKLINDGLGHAQGDKLIIETAKLIQRFCRSGDILARTGGDEFSLLLPKTDKRTAEEIFNKIKRTCSEYNKNIADEIFHINISLGYETKESTDENFEQVCSRAEKAMLQHKMLEHKSSHSAIISSIKATMFEKSNETKEHSERLVALSRMVGSELKFSQPELDNLELYATLHDIGKVGINSQILSKPGPLNKEEWAEMKKHSVIGYRIAMSAPELVSVAEYILSHHERWDGKGYPQGLAGEAIPLSSRILAIVDAYDAMTEDRVYKKAMPKEVAIEEIVRNAGTQFDPNISQIFVLESSNQMQHLGVVNLVRCSVAQAFARPAVELIVHLQHPPFADIV